MSRIAASASSRPAASLARTQEAWLVGTEGDDTEPVAAAARGVTDGQRDALGDVGLAPLGGTERHRGGEVEHDPGREHAIGDLHPDVRLPGTSGDVPVDPSHVVTGAVETDLVELTPDPREGRAVVTGEQPVDTACDRELERA